WWSITPPTRGWPPFQRNKEREADTSLFCLWFNWLVPARQGVEQVLFGGEVGSQQVDEQKQHRQRGKPDGSSRKGVAAEHTDHAAEHEHRQHPQVLERPAKKRGVLFGEEVVQVDAHLPDVVGAEGGGHRDALRLPEGVVLHRADKVDRHL